MFYLSRGEQVALFLLVGLLLAGAGVFAYCRGRHAEPAGPDQPIFVPAGPDASGSGELVVHVSGAVAEPGVYRLVSGSRVADAVERAGGANSEADPSRMNLAARLRDGDKVMVPTHSEAHRSGGRQSQGPPPERRISLNEATAEELEKLPGIGPVYAQRIIAYRERKRREEGRGFQSVDELLDIPGIGAKRFAALRDKVVP